MTKPIIKIFITVCTVAAISFCSGIFSGFLMGELPSKIDRWNSSNANAKVIKQFKSNPYKASVIKIIDGDTVDFDISLGFGISYQTRTRLYGINTPEIKGKQKDNGGKSAKRLEYLLKQGDISLEFHDKKDKYGRYLVTIYSLQKDKTVNINEQLISEGLATPYFGGKK